MFGLVPFELGKIWRKKSFLALTAILLLVNVFMLWYVNRAHDENTPPLSAYKAVSNDLSGLSGEEQMSFLADKTAFLNDIEKVERYIQISKIDLNSLDGIVRETFINEMNSCYEIYEKYKDVYASGEYLRYTDSLYAERKFIGEISSECKTVNEYDKYIKSIEENKKRLSGVSIFQQDTADKNSFSARNIEKSWLDHKDMSSENISFTTSRGIKTASENMITDMFLLLSVMLFVGGLITEEKQKGLFYITRATPNGIAKCIGAKLTSLLIHSAAAVFLLYGSNFIFAEITVGIGDLNSAVQSVSIFQESALEITLGQYLLFGALTKTAMLFTFGAAITAVSIVSSKSFVPQLCGVIFLGASYAAFRFIPAYSAFNTLKYLSFWGVFNPKYIYGEYFNFNIGGYPAARTYAALIVCGALLLIAILLCFSAFVKGKSLDIRRVRIRLPLPFIPHGNMFVHESGKILFTNKAIIVVAAFGVLLGYTELKKSYYPTIGEQYYSQVMHTLEGGLNDEKEQFILDEKARYENAFAQIEQIDRMLSDGEIDAVYAQSLISMWEAQTVFYPYFQRIEERYIQIKDHGGEFVYETGYSILFGKTGGGYINDMLIQIICVTFAFSGVMSMEDRKKSWNLLSATARGKRSIIMNKLLVCAIICAVIGTLPWIFRSITITRTFSMNLAETSVTNLPMYSKLPLDVPIWLFAGFGILLQILSLMIAGAVTLILSYKLKSGIPAIFGGLLVTAVPPALAVMGMNAAKWFSLYPLYSLPALI